MEILDDSAENPKNEGSDDVILIQQENGSNSIEKRHISPMAEDSESSNSVKKKVKQSDQEWSSDQHLNISIDPCEIIMRIYRSNVNYFEHVNLTIKKIWISFNKKNQLFK